MGNGTEDLKVLDVRISFSASLHGICRTVTPVWLNFRLDAPRVTT